MSALEAVGLGPGNARFLNLPFYQTGKVKKDPIGQADVDIVLALLDEVRPDLVFVAGDLSDPHGTHRMCLGAVVRALRAYEGASPDVWLYRGAWQEWPLSEASILVPMSAAELRKKILRLTPLRRTGSRGRSSPGAAGEARRFVFVGSSGSEGIDVSPRCSGDQTPFRAVSS